MHKLKLIALLLFIPTTPFAQTTDSLRYKIARIAAMKKATIGVSVLGVETSDTVSLNNTQHFPMLSVFKFHIALAALHEVDKGKLSLAQKLRITKRDLLPDTWSPIREKYPAGTTKLSLADVLKYTVSHSDNNGCDILLRLVGGTETVNQYIHSIGINDVVIKVNEDDMHRDWNAQYANWTTPSAAVQLLKTVYTANILSKNSSTFLWKIMAETSTGTARIKGQLPAGTVVAHKTGLSDTNAQGVTAATNDIGIVTLPDGRHVAISVFVSDSTENAETNEKIIADISKSTWDYFANKTK